MLNSMCKLEYDAENKSGHNPNYKKTHEPIQPSHQHNRQYDKQGVVNQLECPKYQVIIQLHFLQWHGAYFPLEIFLVIQYENQQEIKMLELMQPVSFLRITHSKPGLNIDVIVNSVNVSVRMVNDIVFHIPH